MANHQSLPHHGKPSPALSLMLKEFTERNLRRQVATGAEAINTNRTPREHQENTKRIRREYEDDTCASPMLPACSAHAPGLWVALSFVPRMPRKGTSERSVR